MSKTETSNRSETMEIRWQVRGSVWWRYPGRRKWYRNGNTKPATEADVVAAFAAEGVDVSGATIRRGTKHVCPRCNGRGIYGGGPCFRCYGSAAVWWTFDE